MAIRPKHKRKQLEGNGCNYVCSYVLVGYQYVFNVVGIYTDSMVILHVLGLVNFMVFFSRIGILPFGENLMGRNLFEARESSICSLTEAIFFELAVYFRFTMTKLMMVATFILTF